MRNRLSAFLLVICIFPFSFAQAPDRQQFIRTEAPVFALTHVRVIDGTGAAPKDDQTIVVSDGKIQSVEPNSSAKVPANAQTMDLTGYTVLPGLVGMHNHMFFPMGGTPPMYSDMGSSFPRLYLANGVTTIRTTGSVAPYTDLEIKKLIDAGRMIGPKMHITAPYLEGNGSFTPVMHTLADANDARRMVNFWADEGATSFKAYMHITRAELGAAIQEAHKRGMKLTAHLCSVTFREAAALGIDDLEHAFYVSTDFVADKKPDECPGQSVGQKAVADVDPNSDAVRSLIADLVSHKVALTSTPTVFETFVPGRPLPPGLELLDPQLRAAFEQRKAAIDTSTTSVWRTLFAKGQAMELAFVRAGGTLLVGTDPTGIGGVVAGYSNQRALELLVEGGFTPLEAIRIGTLNGATFLGRANRTGSIAIGKDADLVVIAGDPSVRIGDVRNVQIVFKQGVGYDPAKLIASVKGKVGLF